MTSVTTIAVLSLVVSSAVVALLYSVLELTEQ